VGLSRSQKRMERYGLSADCRWAHVSIYHRSLPIVSIQTNGVSCSSFSAFCHSPFGSDSGNQSRDSADGLVSLIMRPLAFPRELYQLYMCGVLLPLIDILLLVEALRQHIHCIGPHEWMLTHYKWRLFLLYALAGPQTHVPDHTFEHKKAFFHITCHSSYPPSLKFKL
jgi:hypothetical protein